MAEPMLVAQNIRKTWVNQEVLRGVNLSVPIGTVTSVLGPNGAGKTTLIRILSTLDRPDRGTATIAGHDLLREPARVREQISLTGQYAAVDELLTGEENLRLAARLWRLDRQTARRRIRELAERFDLVDAERRPVRTYSGGMKRKLDLALSLIGSPRLLFLDEPTTGLDPRSRNALWETIRDLKRAGVTVLLTTQYLEEADQLADRIAVIDRGVVVADDTPELLKRRFGGDIVALSFENASDATRARHVLGAQAVTDPAGTQLRIATDGTANAVYDLLGRVRVHGIDVASMAIHKPTLDDVFLTLTNHPAIAEEIPA